MLVVLQIHEEINTQVPCTSDIGVSIACDGDRAIVVDCDLRVGLFGDVSNMDSTFPNDRPFELAKGLLVVFVFLFDVVVNVGLR